MINQNHTKPTEFDATISSEAQDLKRINLFLVLHSGHAVSKTYYDSIKLQIGKRLLKLDPEGIYTSKLLCGEEFWEQLSRGEKISAGHCIASMANNGVLPLVMVPQRHEYPFWYRIN